MKSNTMTFGFNFNENNPTWSPTPQYQEVFFRAQEMYLNERLKNQPFLTVNDVFEALGVGRTPQAMVYGWDQDDVIELQLDRLPNGSVQISVTATNIYEKMTGAKS